MATVSYLVVVFMICFFGQAWSMSREQLKKTGSVMKKSCMPKHQVTEDMVGKIEEGQFLEDRNVMCYMACIYQMIGVVKNGKMDAEVGMKQVDLLYPAEVKEAAKKAIAICSNVAKKYNDLCESAYWTAKCVFETDPQNFLFP